MLGITILNKNDAANDMNLVFTEKQADLGTINAAVGRGSLWTNALAVSAKLIGILQIDHSDSDIDLINNLVWSSFKSGPADNIAGNNLPMLLKADEGSTSVYVSGVSVGTPTTAADDYEFIFHIQYL